VLAGMRECWLGSGLCVPLCDWEEIHMTVSPVLDADSALVGFLTRHAPRWFLFDQAGRAPGAPRISMPTLAAA
jgi:hypothetical protein